MNNKSFEKISGKNKEFSTPPSLNYEEETEEEYNERMAKNLENLTENERKHHDKIMEAYEKGKKDGTWIGPAPRELID